MKQRFKGVLFFRKILKVIVHSLTSESQGFFHFDESLSRFLSNIEFATGQCINIYSCT